MLTDLYQQARRSLFPTLEDLDRPVTATCNCGIVGCLSIVHEACETIVIEYVVPAGRDYLVKISDEGLIRFGSKGDLTQSEQEQHISAGETETAQGQFYGSFDPSQFRGIRGNPARFSKPCRTVHLKVEFLSPPDRKLRSSVALPVLVLKRPSDILKDALTFANDWYMRGTAVLAASGPSLAAWFIPVLRQGLGLKSPQDLVPWVAIFALAGWLLQATVAVALRGLYAARAIGRLESRAGKAPLPISGVKGNALRGLPEPSDDEA